MPKVRLFPAGYNGRSLPPTDGVVAQLRGTTTMVDTHRGETWASRGYSIYRTLRNTNTKSGGSWLFTDENEAQTPIYYWDTELMAETGVDFPGAIASGLTPTDAPIFVSDPHPFGGSVFFNGVNSQAQLIRNKSGIVSETFDLPATESSSVAAIPGGSLAAGNYYVWITGLDRSGAVAVETGPEEFGPIAVTANQQLQVNLGTFAPRITHWRIYVQYDLNATGKSVLEAGLESDAAVTTGSVNISSLKNLGPLRNISGVPFTSVMPLDDIDSAWLFNGRLHIASSKSNLVYFSDRGNLNQWHAFNEINAGAESGWSDGVVGGIGAYGSCYVFTRNSIHRVWGTYVREDSGYINLDQEPLPSPRGLVGPNAVTNVNNAIYFMSDDGLAVVTAAGSELVLPNDAYGMFNQYCKDPANRRKTVLCEDSERGYVCVLLPRQTNVGRPMDGASVAGVPDRIYRFDYRNGVWAAPTSFGDIVHLSRRPNEPAGQNSGRKLLMAVSNIGRVLRLHHGWSGGGIVSINSDRFDGKRSFTRTPTQVTYIQSSPPSSGDFDAGTVTLKYPDADPDYPGLIVQKTISSMVVVGSQVTINWLGDLPVPANNGDWTVRPGDLYCPYDLHVNASLFPGVDDGQLVQIKRARVILHHTVGVEGTS